MLNHCMKCVVTTVAVVGALVLAGCSSSYKPKSSLVQAEFQGADGQQATEVVRGDTIMVYLPTHQGSSHTWRLSPESDHESLVTFERRLSQQSTDGLAAPGQPAYDVFTFKADHTGQTTIQFVYDWPWNGTAAPVKRFALDVGVAKPGQTFAAAVTE